MKRALPILVVLLVLAALVTYFLPSAENGGRGDVAARPDTAAPTVTEDADLETPAEVAEPETVAAQAPQAERTELDAAAERRRKQEDDASLRWIEGDVLIPPGVPADERILLLALSHPMDADDLYEHMGPAWAAWEDRDDCSPLLDWAEVEGNGTFRVAVPEETQTAHLAISGRYLWSRRTTETAAPATDVHLASELGAWITGTLRTPAGFDPALHELKGIELELGPDIGGGFNTFDVETLGIDYEARADETGRFEFRGVTVARKSGILAKPDDFAAARVLGIGPEPAEHIELDVPLQWGATLTGRVVNEAGEPVAEADVEVKYPGAIGQGMGELRDAETDDAGNFVLANVALGKLEVSAESAGYRPGKLKIAEEETRDGASLSGLKIVLTEGGTIAGVVRFPDGTPAVDARVGAGPDLSQLGGMNAMGIDWTSNATGVTDEEGRFSLTGLADNDFQVTASKKIGEGERTGAWKVVAKSVKPGGEPLELVLEALLAFTGEVVDIDGSPVPDFSVMATLQGTGGMFGLGAESRRESFSEQTAGEFEMDGLQAGVWDVVVTAKGFATSETLPVTLPDAQPASFILQHAAGVSGTVYDTSGALVVGAKVSLKLDLAARLQSMQRNDLPTTYTDADGDFLLEGLDPGSVELVASLTGFAPSEPVGCDVEAGRVTEGVDLHLRKGGTLTGEILNDEGEPDPGRMIIVQKTPDFGSQHMLKSDANGRFEVENLEPGKWQVVATADFLGDETLGGEEGDEQDAMAQLLGDMEMDVVDIVDGEDSHVVLGAPPADPVHVRVAVQHDGEAVTNAVVSFVPEGAEGISAMKMGFTDAEGIVELDLEHPGTYLATVQMTENAGQQNSLEYRERIPEGKESVELTYELPLGKISGRVRGPEGDPLGGCRVTLSTEGGHDFGTLLGGQYTETVTNEDGTYELPYLRPGTYTVAVGGVALGGLLGGEAAGGRQLRSGIDVGEGQHRDGVDFRLEEPGKIVGKVTDTGGSPVSGAAVFVRDEDGRLVERFSFLTTDANGAFTYDGLAPGRYSVLAKSEELASRDSAPVRVPAGGSGDVTVVLEPGTILLVSVIDKESEEVRARIRVVDPQGRTYEGMLSLTEMMEASQGYSSKEYRIGPLAPGTYKVTATTDDGRTVTKPVTLRGGGERKLKVRLK